VEDAIWPAVVTLETAPAVGDVLARLHRAGVTLGAVSNAYFSGRVLRRELERHGLGEHFAFVLSSGDLGVRKPSRAVFEAALLRAGAAAEATWFVGDTYAEDVVGAARAGLTAVWLRARAPAAGGDVAFRHVSGWAEFGALCAAILPAAAGM
jgi:FMN phosphatase YigB (HAD superfamily)